MIIPYTSVRVGRCMSSSLGVALKDGIALTLFWVDFS
jgi:hypothetical protein